MTLRPDTDPGAIPDGDLVAGPAPDGERSGLEHPARATSSRRRLTAIAVTAFVLVAGLVAATRGSPGGPGAGVASLVERVSLTEPLPRDLAAYQGLGTWADVYDYSPAHQSAGQAPGLVPTDVDAMAAAGVKTLFLQAARPATDARTPGLLVDREILAQFLVRAHRDGLRVVGWYLPTFADIDADLARVRAIAEFSALGHRFDGVALDIEDTNTVPDVATRNEQLVALAGAARAALGTDSLGAIVLPPVQTEVVNPAFWPAFPWPAISADFDAWLPMSYWTFRKVSSGYHDGYSYSEESTRRLRADLGNPAAVVSPIGGIGDEVTAAEIQRFVQSLVDSGAVGGSVYDWRTMSADNQRVFADALAAVTLPTPP